MEENKWRWLRLKIRWAQWKLKLTSDVYYAIDALESHMPGSTLMANLSIVVASKVDKLGYELAEYEDELEDLTLPIPEAEKLFNRSNHAGYAATEYRQLTVLITHRQFRVPKAQLMRMLEGKRQKRGPMTATVPESVLAHIVPRASVC